MSSSILGLADYDRLSSSLAADSPPGTPLGEKPLSETTRVEAEPPIAVSVSDLDNPLDLFPSERSSEHSD